MPVRMTMLLFRGLAPCRLVGRDRRFGETYCIYLEGLSDEVVTGFTRCRLVCRYHSFEETCCWYLPMIIPTN
jgi:hypothetical protein